MKYDNGAVKRSMDDLQQAKSLRYPVNTNAGRPAVRA